MHIEGWSKIKVGEEMGMRLNVLSTGHDLIAWRCGRFFRYLWVVLAGAGMLNRGSFAQDWSVDFGSGVLNYQGELRSERLTSRGMRPAYSFGFRRWVGAGGSLNIRFTGGALTGRDADNPSYLTRRRNLHFETPLHELTMQGQQRLNPSGRGWCMPYVKAGVGIFRVDPFTHDSRGTRHSLFSLSLEGQGLSEYPGVQMPHRFNFSLPVGGGLDLRLTETLVLELDICLRKTFTDQIDGVSGFFPDREVLLRARGAKAVELSYRADELAGEDPYFPSEGTMRGNPKTRDWYYGISFALVWTGNEGLQTYPPRRQLFRPRGWPYRR